MQKKKTGTKIVHLPDSTDCNTDSVSATTSPVYTVRNRWTEIYLQDDQEDNTHEKQIDIQQDDQEDNTHEKQVDIQQDDQLREAAQNSARRNVCNVVIAIQDQQIAHMELWVSSHRIYHSEALIIINPFLEKNKRWSLFQNWSLKAKQQVQWI